MFLQSIPDNIFSLTYKIRGLLLAFLNIKNAKTFIADDFTRMNLIFRILMYHLGHTGTKRGVCKYKFASRIRKEAQ